MVIQALQQEEVKQPAFLPQRDPVFAIDSSSSSGVFVIGSSSSDLEQDAAPQQEAAGPLSPTHVLQVARPARIIEIDFKI
jgi:hypothetical protein